MGARPLKKAPPPSLPAINTTRPHPPSPSSTMRGLRLTLAVVGLACAAASVRAVKDDSWVALLVGANAPAGYVPVRPGLEGAAGAVIQLPGGVRWRGWRSTLLDRSNHSPSPSLCSARRPPALGPSPSPTWAAANTLGEGAGRGCGQLQASVAAAALSRADDVPLTSPACATLRELNAVGLVAPQELALVLNAPGYPTVLSLTTDFGSDLNPYGSFT